MLKKTKLEQSKYSNAPSSCIYCLTFISVVRNLEFNAVQ